MNEQKRLSIFKKLFGTTEAAEALALDFIEAMMESASLMCSDDPSTSIPDKNDIKRMALEYSVDMLNDFKSDVSAAIKKHMDQHGLIVAANREVTLTLLEHKHP